MSRNTNQPKTISTLELHELHELPLLAITQAVDFDIISAVDAAIKKDCISAINADKSIATNKMITNVLIRTIKEQFKETMQILNNDTLKCIHELLMQQTNEKELIYEIEKMMFLNEQHHVSSEELLSMAHREFYIFAQKTITRQRQNRSNRRKYETKL